MINFFRKIRKQLADDNKFFKYARYAIGEILFVAIIIFLSKHKNTNKSLPSLEGIEGWVKP